MRGDIGQIGRFFLKKPVMPSKTMTSKGRVYTLLRPLKESREKQVYKAAVRDSASGAEQEALLKIFINRDQEYQGELASLIKNPSPSCPRLLGFESFPRGGLAGMFFGGEKKALILEYIQGVSLGCLMRRFTLPAAEVRSLLASIYKGLADLQKAGLCHGDLSLDNVLADCAGRARLIDFGKGNYQGQPRGTLPFAAPEILKGGRASFLSDLFSLGVIEFALENPSRWLSMKTKSPEDFLSDSHPLRNPDPQKRFFPGHEPPRAMPSIAGKVQDILASLEGRRAQTESFPANPPQKSAGEPESAVWGWRGGRGFAGQFFPKRPLGLTAFFAALVFFAGAPPASLPPPGGMLKVFTNKWFLISAADFKSYTPFSAPLPPGRHTIKWRSADKEGEKRIYIEPGRTLLLQDQDFLRRAGP